MLEVEAQAMSKTEQGPSRTAVGIAVVVGVALGIVVAVITRDVILGVIAGAPVIAISVGLLRLWTGSGNPRERHP